MGEAKKKIIAGLRQASGRYSEYEVFTDWIRCCAIAISNQCTMFHGDIWQQREDEYISTMKKYERDERELLREMFFMLADALEEKFSDVLGEIYMEEEMGSKSAGQFFTPYHVSKLCARLALENLKPDESGIWHINEPSCGGGGMIIAALDLLRKRGVDYQRKVRVVAQDLDWKGVYMTYLQLSLLGVNAVVVQGDTLMQPYSPRETEPGHILRSPMNMGALI